MAELLLTVEQTAVRLQLSTLTVQRQLRRGALRGIKRGRVWRVPESALLESSIPNRKNETPETRAEELLNDLKSGDPQRRNAAIIKLARCEAQTRAIVESEVEKSVASYSGPEDDLSDWQALEREPFQLPDETPKFLHEVEGKGP